MLLDIIKNIKDEYFYLGLIAILLIITIILVILFSKKKYESEEIESTPQDAKDIESTNDEVVEENASSETNVSSETSEPAVEPVVEEVVEENVSDETNVSSETNVSDETSEPVVEQVVEAEPVVEEVVEAEPVVEEVVEENVSSEPNVSNGSNVSNETSKEEAAALSASEEDKRQLTGKYEVYKDSDFYLYTLKSSNGQVLIESEVYTSMNGVYNAIEAVKQNVVTGMITITKDKAGSYQFKLSAKNHRVLVVSANYPTERGALKASESFKRFALNSEIVELAPEEVVSKISQIKIGKVEPKQGGKIEVVKEDGSYVFHLYASNREIMCTSEAYKTKNGALNGVETFKTAVKDGKFYLVKDKRSVYQFKLYSSSNRLVCVGESYKNKTQAKQSASIVYSYIDNATVEYVEAKAAEAVDVPQE